jgi:DNA-binding ferritin-like protein (Dps family)
MSTLNNHITIFEVSPCGIGNKNLVVRVICSEAKDWSEKQIRDNYKRIKKLMKKKNHDFKELDVFIWYEDPTKNNWPGANIIINNKGERL